MQKYGMGHPLTAFCTNHGLFEPQVMFFSITNNPATFQTMMNNIFQGMIAEGVVCVYLDDILIFTKTLSEHWDIVQRVPECLWEHKLPQTGKIQV